LLKALKVYWRDKYTSQFQPLLIIAETERQNIVDVMLFLARSLRGNVAERRIWNSSIITNQPGTVRAA
jgi:hypothetical protein